MFPPSSSTEEATGCLHFFLAEREAAAEVEKGKQKVKRLKPFMWWKSEVLEKIVEWALETTAIKPWAIENWFSVSKMLDFAERRKEDKSEVGFDSFEREEGHFGTHKKEK